MEKRHIIHLQGKDFVTYEGLLDMAHARGLRVIRTELLQIPAEENGQTAICRAEVELNGHEGPRFFSGIGDANPRNVGRLVAAHTIRMAETRAKARALRDAVNVGMTAYEELAGPEEAEGPLVGPSLERAERVSLSVRQHAPRMATRSQIERAGEEMRRSGVSQDAGRTYLRQHFGKTSRLELSQEEMAAFLDYLSALPSVSEAAESTSPI